MESFLEESTQKFLLLVTTLTQTMADESIFSGRKLESCIADRGGQTVKN